MAASTRAKCNSISGAERRRLLAVAMALIYTGTLPTLVLLGISTGIISACSSIPPATKSALTDAATVIGQSEVNSIGAAVVSDTQNGQKVDASNLEFAAVQGLFGGVLQAVGNGDASTIINSFGAGKLPATGAAVSILPLTNSALAAAATVVSAKLGAPPAK